MQKIKRFLKNYKYSIPTIIVVVVVVIFLATRGGNQVKAETIIAEKGTVAQEVSVTGRVVPASDVALSIQSGGKVTSIPAKVGQNVKAGQTLLRVDSADLQVRLARQQASLAKTKLAYSKQAPGTFNATEDLKKAQDDGFNTIADTFLDLPSIITGLDDIINDWRHSPYLEQEALRPLGQTALDTKQEVIRNYGKAKESYDTLYARYKAFNRTASPAELEAMLNDTYAITKNIADTVKATHNLVDYVENRTDTNRPAQIDTDQATLDTYTQETNTDLSALLSIKNAIKNGRDAINNESSDTESSQIDIRQAELDIQDTLVQINNRTIKSPVSGIVTDVKAEVGETISPGTPVISVISDNQYEIEANIPEADMAKVRVDAYTDVTLDAYGSDVVFKAKVVSINPSETLIEGVATYKTQFQFIDNDDRIKSGMTASLIIKGEKKENVIAIPQRSVITKGDNKFVQILVNEKIVEKPVQTGLRGSDGSIEIVSGINEGDKVVVFNEQK